MHHLASRGRWQTATGRKTPAVVSDLTSHWEWKTMWTGKKWNMCLSCYFTPKPLIMWFNPGVVNACFRHGHRPLQLSLDHCVCLLWIMTVWSCLLTKCVWKNELFSTTPLLWLSKSEFLVWTMRYSICTRSDDVFSPKSPWIKLFRPTSYINNLRKEVNFCTFSRHERWNSMVFLLNTSLSLNENDLNSIRADVTWLAEILAEVRHRHLCMYAIFFLLATKSLSISNFFVIVDANMSTHRSQSKC